MAQLGLPAFVRIGRILGEASARVYSNSRTANAIAAPPYRGVSRGNVWYVNRFYTTTNINKSDKNDAGAPPAGSNSTPEGDKPGGDIETILKDMVALKESLATYEDKYKRALAESENVRRRMTKQVEEAKAFGIQSFCKDLLDIADTLSKAADSVPADELSNSDPQLQALHSGVALTLAQLKQVFSRHGLSAVDPMDQKFDPNMHEALFQQQVEGKETGTVIVVSKIGYKLHERCLRPALVGVAK